MFFKEVNEIDLGETTIANIFIDIFMPMANGLYVKVYLLGYRQACDPNSNPKFDNNSIAKNLNIPLSDVIDAWKFWQNKNIIRMHKNEGLDDFDYSIEFLDLKKFYMDNMHINTKSIKSNSDSIVSASENPSVRKMFTTINKIVGRYLDPGEKISILEIMNKYPNLQLILEEDREMILNRNECKMLQKLVAIYMDICDLEEKEIFLLGGKEMYFYLKDIGVINK